jgi:hypothetical protein
VSGDRAPRKVRKPRRRASGGTTFGRYKRPRMPPAERNAIAALGPLLEVEPVGRDVDGKPLLGRDQVYAFVSGTVFHTDMLCTTVAVRWDEDPASVKVISESTVGRRRRCKDCADNGV